MCYPEFSSSILPCVRYTLQNETWNKADNFPPVKRKYGY